MKCGAAFKKIIPNYIAINTKYTTKQIKPKDMEDNIQIMHKV